MSRFFQVICLNCYEKAREEQVKYEGLVNHNYTVIDQSKGFIDYHCFSCGWHEEELLNLKNPRQQKPNSKEEYIYQNTKTTVKN